MACGSPFDTKRIATLSVLLHRVGLLLDGCHHICPLIPSYKPYTDCILQMCNPFFCVCYRKPVNGKIHGASAILLTTLVPLGSLGEIAQHPAPLCPLRPDGEATDPYVNPAVAWRQLHPRVRLARYWRR